MTSMGNRLAATFAGPRNHVLIREPAPHPTSQDVETTQACPADDVWTVGRLLAYAADVERALPADAGPLVGVRGHSAAFVVAASLGLWRSGRAPLLIDPALTTEPSSMRVGDGPMLVMAPASVHDIWASVHVGESGGAPVTARLPLGDDLEVAFFTSGSTGEPKIVRKQARQFEAQHAREIPWHGLSGAVTVLSFVPAYHILGYIYALSTPAAGSGCAVFAPKWPPRAWLDRIRDLRPALVVGVPSHYRLLSQLVTEPLPPATYLCSGGPLDPAVGEAFRRRAGCDIVQIYGSTETAGIAARRGAGAWEPFPGLRWQARASDGRLLLDAPWLDVPGEWFVTDDVAAEEGTSFRLIGRADSVVKVGGRRFSTSEIVKAAATLPAVEQAHAVVYSRFGEAAVALFVVPRRGAEIEAGDVRAALASRLAAFKIPRTIHVVSALPMRGIGKVDEEALRSRV